MDMKQRPQLMRLLIPQLNQSLKILSLPLLELKSFVDEELVNNPFLEETRPSLPSRNLRAKPDLEFRVNLITKKPSLQDVLLRQLGMFANSNEEFSIGQEIIGNIDENGYLTSGLEEISARLNTPKENVESCLKLIQKFEPPGVAARSISECLLLQLELANEKDPHLLKIVECHLEDVAKKNYTHIAKTLKAPPEEIEPLVKKLLKLDPKPGRNYSSEEIQHVIPDITITDKGEEWEISINDEDIPTLNINKEYKAMLKETLDTPTKEFLKEKLITALELLRAVFKRKFTLKRIVETIVELQEAAIRNDLSHLKPLTFKQVAERINMHESTVCRAVMNKYVKLPNGVVALKDFFPSSIQHHNGETVSSSHVKRLIKELIDAEDKKHPLSDLDIAGILSKEKQLTISRRTVAKYREDLKILSTSFRRER